jgi:23S rRNA (uracil1939-C5)-methyltransferase
MSNSVPPSDASNSLNLFVLYDIFNHMRKVQILIEGVAFGGYGVGRISGKVVFVPYTVTGGRVWIEVTEEKQKYSRGRLIQIVDPSPWRVNPPCPYFGTCGGCQWQHIDYPYHAELKKAILRGTLERVGKLRDLPPMDIILSPEFYDYRVRVQLKVRGQALGYYRERSHEIVDIDHCPISDPLVNLTMQELRGELTAFSRMEGIEINVSPDEKKAVLVLHPLVWNRDPEDFVRRFFQNHPILKGIAIVARSGLKRLGDPSLHFTVSLHRSGEKRTLGFRASALSFFQVNPEQNRRLIETVLEFSGVRKNEILLDLYAGIGNFTLPLAAEAATVIGVEGNRTAIEDARFNAEKNGMKNCAFLQGGTEEVLKNLSEKPDDVILDPPRTGCKTILDQVVGLKPKKIIYVSCEPTTFSRDIRLFAENGYSLQRLTLIDMFPQTYHMEVIGLLQQS